MSTEPLIDGKIEADQRDVADDAQAPAHERSAVVEESAPGQLNRHARGSS